MIGSTIIGTLIFFNFEYIILIICELYTIPILIASISKSDKIESNCNSKLFLDTGSIEVTFFVF